MQKPGINLTAKMLAELPPDLLQSLDDTTLMLNMDAILKVIERISEHAPDTAPSLRLLVQNFQVDQIREMLRDVAAKKRESKDNMARVGKMNKYRII